MKPETRDRLLAGIDRATASLTQFSSIDSVFAWLWEFSGRVHRKLDNVRTREQIEALLDAEPEPSTMQVQAFEAVIRFSPYLLNRLVKKAVKQGVKGLPGNPPGPKPLIKSSEKAAMCAFIGNLYGKGVLVQDAQKRAAMKWSISLRSVERIWAQRTDSDESEGSIEDAERTLMKLWQ